MANAAKSAVARPEERHFVGFRLQHRPDGDVEVLLSARSRKRVERKLRELTPRMWGQSISSCILALNAFWLGWIGFFGICTEGERRKIQALDAHARRRLRAIQVRHWKLRSTIVARVIQLGVKRSTAMRNVYGRSRSWWALSHCSAVDRALRPLHWRERGLLSVEERWDSLRASIDIDQRQLTLQIG